MQQNPLSKLKLKKHTLSTHTPNCLLNSLCLLAEYSIDLQQWPAILELQGLDASDRYDTNLEPCVVNTSRLERSVEDSSSHQMPEILPTENMDTDLPYRIWKRRINYHLRSCKSAKQWAYSLNLIYKSLWVLSEITSGLLFCHMFNKKIKMSPL